MWYKSGGFRDHFGEQSAKLVLQISRCLDVYFTLWLQFKNRDAVAASAFRQWCRCRSTNISVAVKWVSTFYIGLFFSLLLTGCFKLLSEMCKWHCIVNILPENYVCMHWFKVLMSNTFGYLKLLVFNHQWVIRHILFTNCHCCNVVNRCSLFRNLFGQCTRR